MPVLGSRLTIEEPAVRNATSARDGSGARVHTSRQMLRAVRVTVARSSATARTSLSVVGPFPFDQSSCESSVLGFDALPTTPSQETLPAASGLQLAASTTFAFRSLSRSD